MATTVRKLGYYSTKVSNRPGTGAHLLDALKVAGVNLLAFTGFPQRGGAQVDFIPENEVAFRRVARKAGLKLSARKIVFLMHGDDRPGALTTTLGKLAQARINLVALDAVMAGKKRFGAIFWVKKQNVGRAARILKAR
jgi:hypothetical protein